MTINLPPALKMRPVSASTLLVCALFALVLVFRIGWMVSQSDELLKDTDSYLEAAGHLAKDGVFGVGSGEVHPTATRPPLYPVLLSFVANADGEISVVRVAMLNLALSMGTILFTGLFVVRAVPGSPLAAVISALLVACDPLLVAFSAQAMTETPAACLTALSCWLFAVAMGSDRRWPALALGLALGLATLSRSSFLPVALIGAPMLAWVRFGSGVALPGRFRSALAAGALCLLGTALAIVPWALRNYAHFGKPILATIHGGYALAVANSPDYLHYVRDVGREAGPWSLERFDETISRDYALFAHYKPGVRAVSATPEQELAMDALFYELAVKWIQEDPEGFLFLTADRFLQFWNPLPHPTSRVESAKQTAVRTVVGVWYASIFVMMLLCVLLLGRRLFKAPLAWPLIVCVIISGIHLFFWSNMRMRAPVMPCISVFASLGIVSVWRYVLAIFQKDPVVKSNAVAAVLQCEEI